MNDSQEKQLTFDLKEPDYEINDLG
jgi:hypothetical protein